MPAAQRDHYDSPWKSALLRHFPAFMAFFFADQWARVDWRRPVRFHDKELQQFLPGAQPAGRIADALACVHLKGRPDPVLLHVEVQVQRDEHLPQRLLDYNYLIRKKYRRPVASLVLLADAAPGWRPPAYVETLLGCTLVLQYGLAKLTDFAVAVGKPSAIHSPFALLTAAHVLTQQTHGKPDQRFAAKWRLLKRLFELGWGKRRIMDLFAVINWLMVLPEALERKLWQNIRRLERRRQVKWISPLEQTFIEKGFRRGVRKGLEQGIGKGLEKGIAQGIELGIERGRREGAARLLEEQLSAKFGDLSPTVRKRLTKAELPQLLAWSAALLEARSISQVFSRPPSD